MTLSEAAILVVDDEAALRDIFAKWLRVMGCERVSTAANGSAALELLVGQRFDLLITDVRMPVMDGVALVRNLAEAGVSVPSIVFVSGFGDVDKREMYALGVEAFLAKPLRLEELRIVAERALAERIALWMNPMEAPPRQKIVVLETAERKIRLGRGGFSAHYAGVLSVGRVAFQCLSSEGDMVGEGYVRWRSRPDDQAGIEFAYLAEDCRTRVIAEIEALKPRSFIPE